MTKQRDLEHASKTSKQNWVIAPLGQTKATDAIQELVRKLVESNKQRSRDIVVHRRRYKREQKVTQEVKHNNTQFLASRRSAAQNDFQMSKRLFVQVNEIAPSTESIHDPIHPSATSVPLKHYKISPLSYPIYLPNFSRRYHGHPSFIPCDICTCPPKSTIAFPG